MLKRKRKNPENKKTLRHLAEFLADAIENHNIVSYLYADKISLQLKKEDPLFCEDCQDFMILDRIQNHDPQLCFEDINIDDYNMSYKALEEAVEDLVEDLSIRDYVNVFRYEIQIKKYKIFDYDYEYTPNIDLSGLDLPQSDLSGVDLSGASLFQANLTEANLTKVDLTETDLFQANLSGANLSKAKLYKTKLIGANLQKTNLTEADLSQADLYLANLTKANLTKSDLRGANLSEATLYKTDFTEAKIRPTTIFKNAKKIDDAFNLKLNNPVNTSALSKKFKMTK